MPAFQPAASPGAVQGIRVEGLADLMRAFAVADKTVKQDMRDALQEAAAPVRAMAQSLAVSEISHMGMRSWRMMRIGAYSNIAYVAPVERGVKGMNQSRRRGQQFANLLLEKAMIPALERNRAQVEHRIGLMLDEMAHLWQRR